MRSLICFVFGHKWTSVGRDEDGLPLFWHCDRCDKRKVPWKPFD